MQFRPTLLFLSGLLLLGGLLAPARAAQLSSIATPVLKWQYAGCNTPPHWCDTGWYASPAVADLDGDGKIEVIWGHYDLFAINGEDGSIQWTAQGNARIWPGIALADLTGDGAQEIAVGRGSDQLTVYNGAGGVIWARNPFGGGEVRTLAVEDLEQDGQLEIVVGRAGDGRNGERDIKQVSVYEPDGSVRAGWPARRSGEPGYGANMYNENVAIGDLNGDGFKEIFAPTDTHYITALDRNGNQLPVTPAIARARSGARLACMSSRPPTYGASPSVAPNTGRTSPMRPRRSPTWMATADPS